MKRNPWAFFELTTESWNGSKTHGNLLICQHDKHLILGQKDAFLLKIFREHLDCVLEGFLCLIHFYVAFWNMLWSFELSYLGK